MARRERGFLLQRSRELRLERGGALLELPLLAFHKARIEEAVDRSRARPEDVAVRAAFRLLDIATAAERLQFGAHEYRRGDSFREKDVRHKVRFLDRLNDRREQ